MRLDTIINRDALCALRELPAESVHCCVTSPPYYALRDYGMDAQIGREDTPEQYIARLVEVFRELKRVLRPDGTFWLNICLLYTSCSLSGFSKRSLRCLSSRIPLTSLWRYSTWRSTLFPARRA